VQTVRYRWAVAVVVVGLACVGAAHLWVGLGDAPDANIGAGLFVLLGWMVTAGGLVMLALTLLLAVSRRRR